MLFKNSFYLIFTIIVTPNPYHRSVAVFLIIKNIFFIYLTVSMMGVRLFNFGQFKFLKKKLEPPQIEK